MRVRWNEAAHDAFARASLPRRIYYLLSSVAEADAPMTPAERETVRHFVLERFADPVDRDEAARVEEQPFPITDRAGSRGAHRCQPRRHGARLAVLLVLPRRVRRRAFSRSPSISALHEVRARPRASARRARGMLFHLARAQFLRGDARGERGGPHPDRPPAADARAHALTVLGLPAQASPEQIRRRHRELVRRFHPDAQPNLGPVAQREATRALHRDPARVRKH
jgi:hypothetical protein